MVLVSQVDIHRVDRHRYGLGEQPPPQQRGMLQFSGTLRTGREPDDWGAAATLRIFSTFRPWQ